MRTLRLLAWPSAGPETADYRPAASSEMGSTASARTLSAYIQRVPALHQPELLSNHERVVADGEPRVAERLTHLRRVPEPFVRGPLLRDRGISLALAERVGQVDIAQPQLPHGDGLDHRDPIAGRVNHRIPLSSARTGTT